MSTTVDFVSALAARVSQEFLANPGGFQPWGHTGRDYACAVGTPIYAIADGTVLYCGAGNLMPKHLADRCMMIYGSSDSGNVMFIQHDGWVSLVAHLSNYPKGVDDNLPVKRGQIVAFSGNTGRSTGPHAHVETFLVPASSQPVFSRYNPIAQIEMENRVAAGKVIQEMQPNWRKNGNHVTILRSAPKITPDNRVGEVPPNRIDAFVGYVISDSVSVGGVTSNIWYVDRGEDGKSKERYAWAGGFTEQKVTGLPNLTPTAPITNRAPNQRLTGPAGANIRPLPDSNSPLLRSVGPNKIEAFTHFVRTGKPLTISGVTTDLWYKDSLGYAWAGVFTEQSTNGLVEFKLNITPEPAPETPKPVKSVYTFEKSIPCVTEVVPAGRGNFEEGNFPDKPKGIFLHQFIAGVQRFDAHLDSVVNEFLREGIEKSSNLVIEKKKITQMVKYGHRSYHAGKNGNDWLGFETYGGQDEETKASVAKAIYETEKLYGYKMELKTHNSVMATQCGDEVDLLEYRRMADALHALDSGPELPDASANKSAVLDEFFAWLKTSFLNRK